MPFGEGKTLLVTDDLNKGYYAFFVIAKYEGTSSQYEYSVTNLKFWRPYKCK